MILEILKYPDPRLKRISEPVTSFDPPLHTLIDNLIETMYKANGVGLAAPQVGEIKRLFVIDISPQDSTHRQIFEIVNPVLSNGQGSIRFEEGCLSVPGIAEEVVRKERIHIDYQDRFGHPQSMDAEGLLAVALQHENDHLDGVLFVERLSPLRRRLIKKKLNNVVTL